MKVEFPEVEPATSQLRVVGPLDQCTVRAISIRALLVELLNYTASNTTVCILPLIIGNATRVSENSGNPPVFKPVNPG